jgi:hypothetical protein
MEKEIILESRVCAKDFAKELCNYNVIEKGLNTQSSISKERADNNRAVRDMLLQRGVLVSVEKKVEKTGTPHKKQ